MNTDSEILRDVVRRLYYAADLSDHNEMYEVLNDACGDIEAVAAALEADADVAAQAAASPLIDPDDQVSI